MGTSKSTSSLDKPWEKPRTVKDPPELMTAEADWKACGNPPQNSFCLCTSLKNFLNQSSQSFI